MKARLSTVAVALVLGVASMSSASAFNGHGSYGAFSHHDVEATGSFNDDHRMPSYLGCPMSSAAEGNANQQAFPVQQYGQTSGGTRC